MDSKTLSIHPTVISVKNIFKKIIIPNFTESVRKYPTLPFLNRFCTKEYPIPNLGLTIPEGTPIVISLLGLMRDPDNFPDPDNYLPDRFSEDKPMYNPDAFIPFGDGPRSCIGKAIL